MLLVIAGFDTILLVVVVLRVAYQLRTQRRIAVEFDRTLADHGVDVTVIEPSVLDGRVVLAETDGTALRSAGFTLAVGQTIAIVPPGTPVRFDASWLAREPNCRVAS